MLYIWKRHTQDSRKGVVRDLDPKGHRTRELLQANIIEKAPKSIKAADPVEEHGMPQPITSTSVKKSKAKDE